MVRLAELDRHYLLGDLLEAAEATGDRLAPLLAEYRDECGGFDTEPDQPAPTPIRTPYKASKTPPKAIQPYRKVDAPVSTPKPLELIPATSEEKWPLAWFAVQGLHWEAKFSKTDLGTLQRRIEGWAVQTYATERQVTEWLRQQLVSAEVPEKIGNAANYVSAFLPRFRGDEIGDRNFVPPEQRRDRQRAATLAHLAEVEELEKEKAERLAQPDGGKTPWAKAGITGSEYLRRLANGEEPATIIQSGPRPKRTLETNTKEKDQ